MPLTDIYSSFIAGHNPYGACFEIYRAHNETKFYDSYESCYRSSFGRYANKNFLTRPEKEQLSRCVDVKFSIVDDATNKVDSERLIKLKRENLIAWNHMSEGRQMAFLKAIQCDYYDCLKEHCTDFYYPSM